MTSRRPQQGRRVSPVDHAGAAAMEETGLLLEMMEQLLIASRGRSHLEARMFGGLGRLSQRLAGFLDHGSIHRGPKCEVCCAKFVRTVLGDIAGVVGSNFRDYDNAMETGDDVRRWLANRIVESNLRPALRELVRDPARLEAHYEPGAFVRQAAATRKLLRACGPFDNMDPSALAEVALSNDDEDVEDKVGGGDDDRLERVRNPAGISKMAAVDEEPLLCLSMTELEEGDGLGEGQAGAGARPKARKRTTTTTTTSTATTTTTMARTTAMTTTTTTTTSTKATTTAAMTTTATTTTGRSWLEMVPASGGWHLPVPASEDESLVSFIISGQFSRHQAPLDQDNAHMILAEALIHASASLKLRPPPPAASKTVSPEATTSFAGTGEEAGISASRRPSNPDQRDDDDDDEAAAEEDGGRRRRRIQQQEQRLRLPDGSLLHTRSAEATALNLLFSLNDPHKAKASELNFLVDEQQAPQKLLPLPSGFAVVPEDHQQLRPEDLGGLPRPPSSSAGCGDDDPSVVPKSAAGSAVVSEVRPPSAPQGPSLRGTLTWAPPRPQLILQIHPKKRVKQAMREEQNYLCNDCGVGVHPSLVDRFRLCHYFGKYCCTTCHTNQVHVLPAHIVHRWDFKEYPVSNFAHSVLTTMAMDPLFAVEDLNPGLVKKVSRLRKAMALRCQASAVAKYIGNCRLATKLSASVKDLVGVRDPKTLSLVELCRIREGEYAKTVKDQLYLAIEHVFNCQLCKARGFLCEGCRSPEVIFPFQGHLQVFQCPACFACYHRPCFSGGCTKCLRLQQRATTTLADDVAAKV